MSKIKILPTILFTIGVFLAGVVIWDGAFLKTKYDISTDQYDEEEAFMSETQFQLIQSGIQSASSHNMQPWKVQIVDQTTFTLYADKGKALPVIDPENKQMLISQGTFIGAVKEGAKNLGVKLEITYHPIQMADQNPQIATFKIKGSSNTPVDAKSSATTGVKSDVKEFEIEKNAQQVHALLPDYQAKWITDEKRGIFQEYLRKGTQIESENQQATEELLQNFRFTKWAKNKYRYGLSLNTMSPLLRVFVEPLLGLTSEWESFGQSSMKTFEQRLEKEEGYLILSKDNPKPSDYIQVGEAISTLGLSAKGYTLRPAVQLLQPLEGIDGLYTGFKKAYDIKGDTLMILGFTKKTDGYHESVRHKVLDIVRLRGTLE